MIDINVYADTKDAAYLAGVYSPARVSQAASRAINYALARTKTQVKREITTGYRLPSSLVGNSALVVNKSNRVSLLGELKGNVRPESLAHFPFTSYNGMDTTKSRKTKSGYDMKYGKLKRDGGRAGVFVQVVAGGGHVQNIKTAFVIMNGASPLIMARGVYKGSAGFAFGKPRLPIAKLNTKSVYWATLHPKSISRWQPFTNKFYVDEVTRLLRLQTIP